MQHLLLMLGTLLPLFHADHEVIVVEDEYIHLSDTVLRNSAIIELEVLEECRNIDRNRKKVGSVDGWIEMVVAYVEGG